MSTVRTPAESPYVASKRSSMDRAMRHPVRRRIVAYLYDHESATPAELAHLWPELSLSVVSYHFRRLAELRVITMWRRTQQRGATVHHYRLAQGQRPVPDPSPSRSWAVEHLDGPALAVFLAEMQAVEERLHDLVRDTKVRLARGSAVKKYPVRLAFSVNDTGRRRQRSRLKHGIAITHTVGELRASVDEVAGDDRPLRLLADPRGGLAQAQYVGIAVERWGGEDVVVIYPRGRVVTSDDGEAAGSTGSG